MKPFPGTNRFLIATMYAAIVVWTGTVSSLADSNFNFYADVIINSNLTVYSITLAGQTLSNWPGISTILMNFGSDAGDLPISDLSELQVNDRFHAASGPSGRGVYEIENDYSEEQADFASAYSPSNFFRDAQSGDMCLRSLVGAVRIGYSTNTGTLNLNSNSSLVVATNGAVTVTSGPLYLTPQGDLLMGSFTNSPPH